MGLDSVHERLRWSRHHHGQYPTATEAARAFGWPVSTYLGHENGDRVPSRAKAKQYARAYRVRWEWLLEKDGPASAGITVIKIVGEVDALGQAIFYPAEKFRDCADVPLNAGVATVALDAGATMRGVADGGWLYFFDDEKKPAGPHLMGKLCVVQLKNGDVFIRVLQPGRKKGRYDLESSSAPTMRDQQVTWAARVSWIKPR